MSNSRDLFHRTDDFHGTVRTANNDFMKTIGKGDIRLELEDTETVVIRDVFHVPEIAVNLLSISEMPKKGNSVLFKGGGCNIFDAEDQFIASATLNDAMYKLNVGKSHLGHSASAAKESELELWNRRLAHLNINSMKQLQQGVADGITFPDANKIDCIACARSETA